MIFHQLSVDSKSDIYARVALSDTSGERFILKF